MTMARQIRIVSMEVSNGGLSHLKRREGWELRQC